MNAQKKEDHGKNQAQAQYESICEMVAALNCDYDRLEALRDERDEHQAWRNVAPSEAEELTELEKAAGKCTSQDEARERIQEDALEISVRSGWVAPAGLINGQSPEEYKILLCTSGPAVRICGELNQHGEPSSARLEYQDWFTPWEEYHEADQDVLLDYARCFYFGEGCNCERD